MKWNQLKVTCPTASLDDVCAVMSMLDSGLMIEDYRDIGEGMNAVYGELIDEELLKCDKNTAGVSIYLSEDRSYSDCMAYLRDRFNTLGIEVKIEVIGLDEEDWANSWKKFYKPLKIGKKLVVVPRWEKYDAKEDEITLLMDPGMAFGSGTHETTRLCASLLEEHLVPGQRVLDVGTGSGILSIAASKLGASSIYACDIDPVAVRVAKDNFEENGVTNADCGVSDLLKNVDTKGGLYDVVCANIVADIVIRLSKDVGSYVKYGGIVIASGIIATQADEVVSAMEEAGFGIADAASDNDWRAFVFRRLVR